MQIEDLKSITWEKGDSPKYKEFIKFLEMNSDKKYLDFNKRITPDLGESYGVRMPLLRKMVKYMAKGNNIENIYELLGSGTTYEEKLLQGMLLPCLKYGGIEQLFQNVDSYILRINNWALCDSFCVSLNSAVRKNKDEFYERIIKYTLSSNPWAVRFSLVMLNDYYVDKKYLDNIFDIVTDISSSNYYINDEHYYVNMAVAWLISTCYITDSKAVINFIKQGKMNNWCTNKAIQKIIESRKVNEYEKQYLKTLKL